MNSDKMTPSAPAPEPATTEPVTTEPPEPSATEPPTTAAAGPGQRWKRPRPRPRRQWQADLSVLLVVAAAVVVLSIGVPYVVTAALLGVLISAACYGLFAMGTNVLVGWSGLITFGQAAFFGAGGYCVALMHTTAISPPLKLLIAGAITAAAGLVLAVGLARFLHITFAMLTLVAGQLIYLVAFQTNLVGGENGIAPVLRGSVAGISIETDVNFWPYAVIVLAVISVCYWRFYRSMFVLRLMASRDDELRAQSLGLSVVALRGVAGAVAGGVAGIGGGLYAQYAGAINPTLLYFDMSGIAIFMCLLGGARYLWGPLVGGLIYAVGVGDFLSNTNQPDVYIGIAFMLLIIVLPGGLLSLKSRLGNASWPARARARKGTT
jgi:branched-chain amino acid transport system permease protein